MAGNEEKMKLMDDTAREALIELNAGYASWSAKDLVAWWMKWYLKTGHKRLGRLLVGRDGEDKRIIQDEG